MGRFCLLFDSFLKVLPCLGDNKENCFEAAFSAVDFAGHSINDKYYTHCDVPFLRSVLKCSEDQSRPISFLSSKITTGHFDIINDDNPTVLLTESSPTIVLANNRVSQIYCHF